MARKKKEPAVQPTPAKPEIRAVRLGLSPEYHRLLRLIAADEETSMADFAQAALMKVIDHEAKKRGIKG